VTLVPQEVPVHQALKALRVYQATLVHLEHLERPVGLAQLDLRVNKEVQVPLDNRDFREQMGYQEPQVLLAPLEHRVSPVERDPLESLDRQVSKVKLETQGHLALRVKLEPLEVQV